MVETQEKFQDYLNFETEKEKQLKKLTHYTGLDFTRGYYACIISEKNRKWVTKQKKSISQELFEKHLTGQTTIALPQFPTSKYLIFDIDTRSQYKHITVKQIFEKIKKDFGQPAYYESSSTTSGYHLYYHMNDYITDEAKKRIEEHYRYRYLMEVEVLRGDKKIRLPYSKSYQENAFDKFNEPITSFEHLYNTFENMYLNPFYQTKIPTWVQKFNIKGEAIQKERETSDTLNSTKNRTYGYGTRHIEQIKIAFDVIRDKKTFEDFISECEYWNDGTSKDMKLPYESKIKMLQKIWSWCLMHYTDTPEYTKNEQGTFIDEYGQEIYLDSIEYTLNSKQYNQLNTSLTFYYRYYNIGKIGGVKEKEFIHNTILLIEKIISKKIYDKKTSSQYNTKNAEINRKLSQGVLLNHNLKKLIADSLKIPNYKKIWNFLEIIGFINAIKVNGYTYSYKSTRYAKHYIIMTIDKFYRNYINTIITYYNTKTKRHKKNINYVNKFFLEPVKLTDGKLEDRLLKIQLWRKTYGVPYKSS